METEEIAAVLHAFVRQRFGVPIGDTDFNDDVDLFNYGYVDSFGAVELGAFIETHFAISIDSRDWMTCPMSTIRELATFVYRRKNES